MKYLGYVTECWKILRPSKKKFVEVAVRLRKSTSGASQAQKKYKPFDIEGFTNLFLGNWLVPLVSFLRDGHTVF